MLGAMVGGIYGGILDMNYKEIRAMDNVMP